MRARHNDREQPYDCSSQRTDCSVQSRHTLRGLLQGLEGLGRERRDWDRRLYRWSLPQQGRDRFSLFLRGANSPGLKKWVFSQTKRARKRFTEVHLRISHHSALNQHRRAQTRLPLVDRRPGVSSRHWGKNEVTTFVLLTVARKREHSLSLVHSSNRSTHSKLICNQTRPGGHVYYQKLWITKVLL